MAADRDLNVAVLAAEAATRGRFLRGWEMLAATGVRGLRLLNESAALDAIVSTEWNDAALPILEQNAVRYADRGARAIRHDARAPLEVGAFDYVDLDPYGSPLPFLDAALAAVRPGGLIAVTATDLRVLAGVDAGAALRLYGGRPVRGPLGPEGGLRLLLAAMDRRAKVVGRGLRPRLAYVGGHHLRAYVRVTEPREAAAPIGVIEESEWTGPTLGNGAPFGPLWLGSLLDRELVERLEAPPTAARPGEVARRIELLHDEWAVDRPFSYDANSLAERLHLDRPPSTRTLAARLAARGYRLARSQVRAGSFRTDAPRDVVDEAARELPQSQNDRVRA